MDYNMMNLLAHCIVAQTYGSGAYSSLAFSSGTTSPLIRIGPMTLPDTGAGWMVLISSAALAIAGGTTVWLWQRMRIKRTRAEATTSS